MAPKRPSRAPQGRWAAVTALICVAVPSVGALGRWSDRADAINFGEPYLLAAAALAVVAALVRTRGGSGWPRAAAWTAAVLLVGSAWALVEALGDRADRSACDGATLRLVEFNSWKGNPSPGAVARWIRATRADLVVLAEAPPGGPLVADLSETYPYRQSCLAELRCSTIIFSRRRPAAGGGLARGDPENQGALSAAWMRLDGAGGPLTLVGVHLGRPWPWSRFGDDRRELADFVARRAPADTVVAGDFNLPGFSHQMRSLDQALGLRRATWFLPSWPAIVGGRRFPVPLVGIDHLFVGRGWSVERLERGPFLGSDHYPIVADLRRCAS